MGVSTCRQLGSAGDGVWRVVEGCLGGHAAARTSSTTRTMSSLPCASDCGMPVCVTVTREQPAQDRESGAAHELVGDL